jgi:hypothetical protein
MEQTNEADSILQEALIESYGKADTWQLKRQILSILAKTMHYKSIIEKIPGLTEYRYYKAKNHSAVYGCALPPQCLLKNTVCLIRLLHCGVSRQIIKVFKDMLNFIGENSAYNCINYFSYIM